MLGLSDDTLRQGFFPLGTTDVFDWVVLWGGGCPGHSVPGLCPADGGSTLARRWPSRRSADVATWPLGDKVAPVEHLW